MASKLSPRGLWANLLGNGTRPCFLSSSPSLLLIWCLFRDDHYSDRSSPSSLFSPSLPYLPSVHSSSTAREQPVQHASNAHLKTSSATYPVGCGTAHSGKRTVARDMVQWSLGHRYSFQRRSKAWTKGHRYLLLFRGRGVNLWALAGVFRVYLERWKLLLRDQHRRI